MADEIDEDEREEIFDAIEEAEKHGEENVDFTCKHGKHIKVKMQKIPEEAIFTADVSQ